MRENVYLLSADSLVVINLDQHVDSSIHSNVKMSCMLVL